MIEFFKKLYGTIKNGYLCIWSKEDRKSMWFETTDDGLEQAAEYASRMSVKQDVYFGVCLQPEALGEGQRGRKDTVSICPGVWVDIDMAGEGHVAENLPSTDQEVQDILKQFPFDTSFIVNSGHGYHAYTLFDSPFVIKGEKDRDRVQNIVTCYQDILRSYCKEKGWKLDSTGDLTRLLRVPGTINHKGSNTLPVKIVGNSGKRYAIEDIESAVTHRTEDPAVDDVDFFAEELKELEIISPSAEDESVKADMDLIRRRCPFINHCIIDAAILPEPEWYSFLTIVSRCRNGQELAHEYSEPYPSYSYEETEEKLHHALDDTGPITCERIGEELGNEACTRCPYKRTVKSPISLGYDSETLDIIDSSVAIGYMIRNIKDKPAQGPAIFEDLKADTNKTETLISLYQRSPLMFGNLIEILRNNEYLRKQDVDRFMKLIEKEAKTRSMEITVADREPQPLSDYLPLSTNYGPLVVPPGWTITEKGIYKESSFEEEGLKEIASAPAFICCLLKDIYSESEIIEVCYFRRDGWQKRYIPREELMQANELVKYAGCGLPISSLNEKGMVDFFQNFEKWNITNIRMKASSERLGWVKGGGFLLGNHFINADGEIIDPEDAEGAGETVIFSSPHNAEVAFIVDALHVHGTYEKWAEAVRKIKDFPVAMLVLYASLVPPLLELLDLPNFAVDLAYRTSSGKTTLQRLAASVYGCPDETKNKTFILNWDSTSVYLGRISVLLNGLPLILNDSKQARSRKLIEQVIYDVANGRTRGRGNIHGIDRTDNIRTVLISSGESPLVFTSESGGLRTRVITINIAPFSDTGVDTGEIVNELNSTIRENFGHAGLRFIQDITSKSKDPQIIEAWKDLFREHKEAYMAKGENSDFTNRLSDYLASIDLAGILFHDALDLPWEFDSPNWKLWDEITKETKRADRCIEALERFYSSCATQRNLFWTGNADQTCTGFIGKWKREITWQKIAVARPFAEKVLLESGYDNPRNIFSEWKDRGFLISEKDRYTKRIRYNGTDMHCIVIRRSALEELGIIGDDAEE